MSQVVIHFEGICVNFSQISFPFLPTKHRIVLINASAITQVWGQSIEPHVAGFSFTTGPGPGMPPLIPLNGAVVRITNPITTVPQTGVTYDSTYHDIPSLTSLTSGLSPESLAVLTGHNPALTSCYFDVDYGTIGSTHGQGGFMTVVTVLTDGDPLYEMKPFATGLSSDPSGFAAFSQAATANMYFWNEEENVLKASKSDFLLSYLVLSQPPSSMPNLPAQPLTGMVQTRNRKTALLEATGHRLMSTDVGCSNSNYP